MIWNEVDSISIKDVLFHYIATDFSCRELIRKTNDGAYKVWKLERCLKSSAPMEITYVNLVNFGGLIAFTMRNFYIDLI